jgi:hypothetical protein
VSDDVFTLEDAKAAVDKFADSSTPPVECPNCHETYYWFFAKSGGPAAKEARAIPLKDRICPCGEILPVAKVDEESDAHLVNSKNIK